MRALQSRLVLIGAVVGVVTTMILLAGCGTASANTAAVSATPTCPPQTAFTSVTGRISSVGSGTFAVTDAQGAVTQVQIAVTTRLTQVAHPAATSLAVGTSVLVLTDTNATVARRINVLGSGALGTGSFGFGGGRPTGTPSARANANCFPRGGQRNGQGGVGQGGNGQFQGIQGTIDSVSSTHLVFHDAQGQAYSVAITSVTVIQRTTQAKASDLKVGLTVTALGTATSSGIMARSVVIQG